MRADLGLPRRASDAEYLAVEQHREHRHELIDGVIVALAGGSDEHNAIAGRLAMRLGSGLREGCRYFTPDQRETYRDGERFELPTQLAGTP